MANNQGINRVAENQGMNRVITKTLCFRGKRTFDNAEAGKMHAR